MWVVGVEMNVLTGLRKLLQRYERVEHDVRVTGLALKQVNAALGNRSTKRQKVHISRSNRR